MTDRIVIRALKWRHVLVDNTKHKVRAHAKPVAAGTTIMLTLCGKPVWDLDAQCFQRLYYGEPYQTCARCEGLAREDSRAGKD